MGRARGGGQYAKGNVILFLTCLSLLNLLIEICIAKLLRPLLPLQYPPPLPRLSALPCAICVLVLLYKVLCIIFNSKNSKGNNNYLAHDVFLAIELFPSPQPVEAPGQTLEQIKQQLQHTLLPPPLLQHHHHHYRLQVIVIVIITAPCHSFCLA